MWSPDGKSLLFGTLIGSKAGVGIFRKASNGCALPARVVPANWMFTNIGNVYT